MKYGKVLEQAMRDKGWNEFRTCGEAGISINTLNKALAGSDRMRMQELKQLCNALGFEIVDIQLQPIQQPATVNSLA